MVPEFGEAAFKQKVGTVSGLVKTQYGTHIIYVRDKAAAGTQPFETVKADLKQFLTRKAKTDTVQNLIDGLKSSAKIEYYDESLKPEVLKAQMDKALESETKTTSDKEEKKEEKKSAKEKIQAFFNKK